MLSAIVVNSAPVILPSVRDWEERAKPWQRATKHLHRIKQREHERRGEVGFLPTDFKLRQVAAKLNELILALRRP